jgi:hypothetical protein
MLSITPFFGGYCYGLTLNTENPDIVKQTIESPFLTTIDAVSKGAIYGITADVVSKTFIPEKGHKAFTALLLGIASYKLYKFCKSKLAKSESISSYDEEQTTKFTEKIECECLEIDLVREKVKEE